MLNERFVDVVIPFYNSETTIVRALTSLITNAEYINSVILVDDASTDDTLAVAAPFFKFLPNVKIITNETNLGPGPSRRIGIEAATSDWVACLDADDAFLHSSFQYIYEALNDSDYLLLTTAMIYFEYGDFKADDIDYGITSCGGNFYHRQYLVDNNIWPHETLAYSEDECFNRRLLTYMRFHLEDFENYIYYMPLPVYQVYHDPDRVSYSFRDWGDYLCRSHLLSAQYLVDFFDEEDFTKHYDYLKDEYIRDFIFCYMLWKTLDAEDRDIHLDNLRQALNYFETKFKDTVYIIRDWYYDNLDDVEIIEQGALISGGGMFCIDLDFNEFLMWLLDDVL